MNIFIAIVLFSAIILFHEFGHFIVAKANKIGVIEFSLGMGPRIISYVKTDEGKVVKFFGSSSFFEDEKFKGHTIYSWKVLPFGGSCAMLGEMEQDLEEEAAFNQKSVGARMAVIFAGPFFNFILAFILAIFVIGLVGWDKAVVTGFSENSAIQEAGIKEGDLITSIDGEKIVVDREISFFLQFNQLEVGKPVQITYERDGKENTVAVNPREQVNKDGTKSVKLGFFHGQRIKDNVLTILKYSLYEVKFWISTTLKSLYMLASGRVSVKEASGPVGIVKMVGDVVDQSAPEGLLLVVVNVLNMGILLTANLGVMNLLPIPAVDGGRLFLLVIEAIRRKPLPEKIENGINIGGFAFLMLLMVLIMYNDIVKLIAK
ncbi:M50 family metallopeptidase [Eubacterium xylanophilum]|uniref:M50 family metallopeptidase n=1 Tax=Eubacterium xylanophilum TaxID=39497 RepID=UPI00047BD739|nr:M50 family metallopeptidase [Eubacterium xylanophilum]